MKRNLFLTITFAVLCCFCFSSCIFVFDDSETYLSSSDPAIRYMTANYSGTFRNCKKINLAKRYQGSGSYYDDYEYYSVYSSKLAKNIIVRNKKGYHNSYSYNTFESNYLFVENQVALQNYIKEYVKNAQSTYSTLKVYFDIDWIFTDNPRQTQRELETSELNKVPFFIFINSSSYSRTALDKIASKLYENNFKAYKEIYLMNSSNYSKVDSVNRLYENTSIDFDYHFQIPSYSTTVDYIPLNVNSQN